jgi:tRNA (guanine-N(7)-)-methyltransferase subunit TRM82
LATYTENDKTYLVSTGEDKHLHVSILPSLELESSRELVKRANALELTHDGTIIVGDKFGDVYSYVHWLLPLYSPSQSSPPPFSSSPRFSYPLHAPAPPAEPLPKGTEATKALPLLGHVSMLNTLCLVRADEEHGLPRDLIVTGDRDEHVRVSRFPKGHVIERFLWGSKK